MAQAYLQYFSLPKKFSPPPPTTTTNTAERSSFPPMQSIVEICKQIVIFIL
jgi:hypothetical protein